MIGALRKELTASLRAMEVSFHVELIGTFGEDLVCAPADANAAGWLENNAGDIDQFPVRQGVETIGVLHRINCIGNKSVRDTMEPLHESLLVSAQMPIADLIPQLRVHSYRLVLRSDRIDGLVTQSDLLKLPVRLLSFALVTHLEQVMADLIATRWAGDEWLSQLTLGRQQKINEKLTALTNRKMNPPLIELTEFSDKRDLCKKLVIEPKSFSDELDNLRDLRDQLAHAATFVESSNGPSSVTKFVNQFESAKRWIHELTLLVTKTGIDE